MTPIEQWLANNILQILGIFLMGGIAIVYLRSQVKSISKEAAEAKGRADEIDQKIKEHSESEWPHGICRAHAEMLTNVQKGVDELNKKVDKANDLLIDIVRSNKKT